MKARSRHPISTFLTFVCCVLVGGCSDVPAPYRIANTTDPRYEDEDVRFRTTYYLRVFDLCPIDTPKTGRNNYDKRLENWVTKKKATYTIYRDSLYRFRMTGQARALFSNVRFESGTLRAYQLDPFGQTVEFSRASGRFNPPIPPQRADAPQPPNSGQTPSPTSALPSAPSPEQADNRSCPNGEPAEADFFLLGPEGTKRLDPDDRLVMAMSSDARPLVSALQFLSGNLADQETEATLLFRVAYDRQHATRAKDLFGGKAGSEETTEAQTRDDVLTAIDRVLNLFLTNGENNSSASPGISRRTEP